MVTERDRSTVASDSTTGRETHRHSTPKGEAGEKNVNHLLLDYVAVELWLEADVFARDSVEITSPGREKMFWPEGEG
jgi:hypothetical protein